MDRGRTLQALRTQPLPRCSTCAWTAFFALAVFAAPTLVSAAGEPSTHIVRSGETLSEIIEALLGEPIYGPNGNLQRVLRLNPELGFPGDRIRAGQILVLDRGPIAFSEKALPLQTPSSTPDPATIPTQESAWFTLGPRFSYSSLESTDRSTGGQSILASDLNWGAELRWIQQWSDTWISAIGVELESRKYGIAAERELQHASGTYGRIELSGQRRLGSSGASIALAGGVANSTVLRSVDSANVLALDPVLRPELSTRIEQGLFASPLFRIHAGINGAFLAGSRQATFSLHSGYRYGLDIGLEQLTGASRPVAHLFWTRSTSPTSISQQTDSVIGLSIEFRMLESESKVKP